MSDELTALKEVVTHPVTGGGVLGFLGWLLNKVWRGQRHEIANMKAVSTNNTAAIGELGKKLDEHIENDHEWHSRLQQQMADNHSEIKTILIGMGRHK